MIPECTFLYPDGRNCRRIPRRGESLCPDHRRQAAIHRREAAGEQAFLQLMNQAADEIIRLPLDGMLDHAQECLMDVEAFIAANAPAHQRVRFMRAVTAVTAAIDCVDSHPRVLSETFDFLPPDNVNAIVQLLAFARPNYAAQAQALAAAETPEPSACISKHNDALQNQTGTEA